MTRLLIVVLFLAFCSTLALAETKMTGKGNYPLQGTSLHTKAIREHQHPYEDTDTDTDTDINTHPNIKDSEDLTLNLGFEGENLFKLGKNTRIDVAYKKDVNKTNRKQGHTVEAMVVHRFAGFDISWINPFNWLKK